MAVHACCTWFVLWICEHLRWKGRLFTEKCTMICSTNVIWKYFSFLMVDTGFSSQLYTLFLTYTVLLFAIKEHIERPYFNKIYIYIYTCILTCSDIFWSWHLQKFSLSISAAFVTALNINTCEVRGVGRRRVKVCVAKGCSLYVADNQ
jgi:hypothetical protein